MYLHTTEPKKIWDAERRWSLEASSLWGSGQSRTGRERVDSYSRLVPHNHACAAKILSTYHIYNTAKHYRIFYIYIKSPYHDQIQPLNLLTLDPLPIKIFQNKAQIWNSSTVHDFIITTITTGKSFSEALIFASTNPQYDKRLFIEIQVQYMKIASSEHVENMLCT